MNSADNEVIKIASMYYEEGLTQAQIAKERGVSRSLISKYLNDAKSSGVVEVIIKSESIYTVHLERALEKMFHLKSASVVDIRGLEHAEISKRISQRAALHLNAIVKNYDKIGITWGRSLRRMVDSFPFINQEATEIIPLIGGLSDTFFEIQSNQLSYDLARKLRGTAKYLYAPAVVSNEVLKQELVNNVGIQSVLEDGRHVRLALVGISSLHQESNMRKIGYINEGDIQVMQSQGAVGVINSRFFDSSGQEIDHPINRSVIGLTLQDFRTIENVMTLVYGDQKVEAIYAAIANGLIDTIVTTNTIAERLLTLQ